MKLIHVGVGNWGLDWELNALPWVRDTVERVAVRTLSVRNGVVEIASGVNPGDIVVVKPVDGLKDGMRVKARSS